MALFFLSVVRAAAADVYVSIRTIERALDACSPSFSRMQQQQPAAAVEEKRRQLVSFHKFTSLEENIFIIT